MARIIYYYLLALVILIITPFPPTVIADDTKKYIVTLKDGSNTDAHYEWLKNEQRKTTVRMNTEAVQTADPKETLKTFSIGGTNGYVGELSESWVTNVLAKRSDVESVDINGMVHTFAPVKVLVSAKGPQANLDMMDTTGKPLFDKSFTYPAESGKGVKVYVIDTGVLATHVEFQGRAKMAKVICQGCPNTDDHGHGSHVSGTIAGHTVGVAKLVSIFGVKVIDSSGQGSWDDVIAGLQFVADEKKADKSGIFVVNMSIGGPKINSVNHATRGLSQLGVHIVVAAGNDFKDACTISPASTASAITVGAVQAAALKNTIFSNGGPCVDIFAPGDSIRSCGIDSDKSYAVMSGTSMASPHVAGVVALILARRGDMTSHHLAKFLKTRALANKMTFIPGTPNGTPNLFASINKMF